MKNPIWSLDEIHTLPEFGSDHGWFYGLVRDHETGKIRLCEIFPGMGYASAFPLWDYKEARTIRWLPRTLWWIVKDIWKAANYK